MGVDRAGDLVGRGAQRAGQRRLGQHFGHRCPDQVGAQQAVRVVEEQFDESVAVAGGCRLARCGEGKASDFVGDAAFLRLLFGHADRRHLGLREDARRDGRVVHWCGIQSADGLYAANRFGRRHVRQRRARHDVADGIDARCAGAVVLVHNHFVALDGDAQLFEADAFDVGLDAHGRQHDSGSQRLRTFFAFDLHVAEPFGIDLHGFHRGRGQHRRTQFAECAFHGFRHLLVLQGHHAGHILDDRDLHAQCGVKPRELAADGPRSHDDHRFGQAIERQRLPRRDHVLAVDGHEGHFAGPCPRGEDDVVGLVFRSVDVYASRGREASESGDEVDAVLVQQEQHAFRHGFGHAARPCHDLREVRTHLAREFQSVMLCIFAVSVNLCAFQQGFGRDAAPVEAYAARLGAFHERHLPSQLCGADRRYITSGAAAHDDDVVFHYFTTFNISPLSAATARFHFSL